MNSKTRTIGVLASQADVNIETIRFYERKGLISQPIKPISGFRIYPNDTLDRIIFIKRSKELGFTLEEIASLLSVNDSPCNQVQDLVEQKLTKVQQKINDLDRLKTSLQTLLSQCRMNENKSNCPIIDALHPSKN